MLICQNCHRPVIFGLAGWAHLDRDSDCATVAVAWPPPGATDGEEDAA